MPINWAVSGLCAAAARAACAREGEEELQQHHDENAKNNIHTSCGATRAGPIE